MITFNHEAFINDAINSVLNQKTNFPVRLLVSEDYGTDNTRTIIKKLAKEHSQITLLDFGKNQGVSRNFFLTIEATSAKYIALCEGDDYWTDQKKLQEQVDFLERNDDYIAVADNAEILFDDGTQKIFTTSSSKNVTVKDFLSERQVPTAGVLFRRNEVPQGFKTLVFADTPLFVYLAKKGQFYFRDKITSMYRLGAQGITSDIGQNIKKSLRIIHMNKFLDRYTEYKYSSILKFHQAKHYWMNARYEKSVLRKIKWFALSISSNSTFLLNRLRSRK